MRAASNLSKTHAMRSPLRSAAQPSSGAAVGPVSSLTSTPSVRERVSAKAGEMSRASWPLNHMDRPATSSWGGGVGRAAGGGAVVRAGASMRPGTEGDEARRHRKEPCCARGGGGGRTTAEAGARRESWQTAATAWKTAGSTIGSCGKQKDAKRRGETLFRGFSL